MLRALAPGGTGGVRGLGDGDPLCGVGEPWEHGEVGSPTLTPGLAWASAGLRPQDTCLTPRPSSPAASWIP